MLELIARGSNNAAIARELVFTEKTVRNHVSGRSWVYEHAAELGTVKLGSGQTAPLRIPRDGVRRIVSRFR